MVEKAEEALKNYSGGEIQPFLKVKESEMLDWLGRMHRTSLFRLLRGDLSFGISKFRTIYAVAGCVDPGVNGLLSNKEEAVEALEIIIKNGHYRQALRHE